MPVVAILRSNKVVLVVGVVGSDVEDRGPGVITVFAWLFDIARTKSIAGVAEGTAEGTAIGGLVKEIPTGVGSFESESESEVDDGVLPRLVCAVFAALLSAARVRKLAGGDVVGVGRFSMASGGGASIIYGSATASAISIIVAAGATNLLGAMMRGGGSKANRFALASSSASALAALFKFSLSTFVSRLPFTSACEGMSFMLRCFSCR